MSGESEGSGGTDSQECGDPSRLQMALEFRRFHHNSIWEEQKHFTWLISVILSGTLFVLTNDHVSQNSKALVVVVTSALGLLLSLIAFGVERREGILFTIAHRAFVDEWNRAFPLHEMRQPRGDRKYGKETATKVVAAPESAADVANLSIGKLLLYAFAFKRLGVRDYFQVLFLFFAIVFIVLGAYQVWHVWPTITDWFTHVLRTSKATI